MGPTRLQSAMGREACWRTMVWSSTLSRIWKLGLSTRDSRAMLGFSTPKTFRARTMLATTFLRISIGGLMSRVTSEMASTRS